MSTFERVTKECAICGKKYEATEIMSSNCFGSRDLDNRPPQMMRSTLCYQVELCDDCGYANTSITWVFSEETKEIINSPLYRSILLNENINRLAKAFMLAGLLHGMHEEYRTSGFLYLKAAWACDDHNDTANASLARKKAIMVFNEYFKQEFSEEQMLYRFEDKEKEDFNLKMIIVDLLRRSESFKEAISLAKELLKSTSDDLLKKILKFQIRLSRKEDTSCHRVEEVKKKLF